MQEPKKPIGDFIINNSKGTQTENGVYYHYTEVCKLLKLYEKQLLIHSAVGQSEQLGVAWKVLERVGFTRGEEFTDDDIQEMLNA